MPTILILLILAFVAIIAYYIHKYPYPFQGIVIARNLPDGDDPYTVTIRDDRGVEGDIIVDFITWKALQIGSFFRYEEVRNPDSDCPDNY